MINELANEIYLENKAKGFWDKPRNIGELLMLVTSELAEALEADRKNKHTDNHYLQEMLVNDYSWEDSKLSFTTGFKRDIKDTFEDEIADAVIRLFDLAGGLNIDLDFHIKHKREYNKTREAKHGKSY